MPAVVDQNGTILETGTNILVNDLPKTIQNYLKKIIRT